LPQARSAVIPSGSKGVSVDAQVFFRRLGWIHARERLL